MIAMKLKPEVIQKAMQFAESKQPTSFPRFGEPPEKQIERIFVGKLGEIIGQETLVELGIPHRCMDKLRVVDNMGYRDVADCIVYPDTQKQKTVDFKTAWKSFHKRILIPEDMFVNQRKDLYVGVRVRIELREGRAIGYQTADYIETTHAVEDFGEGPAYWAYLEELRPLQELLV